MVLAKNSSFQIGSSTIGPAPNSAKTFFATTNLHAQLLKLPIQKLKEEGTLLSRSINLIQAQTQWIQTFLTFKELWIGTLKLTKQKIILRMPRKKIKTKFSLEASNKPIKPKNYLKKIKQTKSSKDMLNVIRRKVSRQVRKASMIMPDLLDLIQLNIDARKYQLII